MAESKRTNLPGCRRSRKTSGVRGSTPPSPRTNGDPKQVAAETEIDPKIQAICDLAGKYLSRSPYGQMVLQLDYLGLFEASQVDAATAARRLSTGRAGWHLLSPRMQEVLKSQYKAPRKLSARTLWWRFGRIRRDWLTSHASVPLVPLEMGRRAAEDRNLPAGDVTTDLREFRITDRQARKAWKLGDMRRRILSSRDKVFASAATGDFFVLKRLAQAGRTIHIPERPRIDESVLCGLYREKIAAGTPRPVVVAGLARRFGCTRHHTRLILRKRNL